MLSRLARHCKLWAAFAALLGSVGLGVLAARRAGGGGERGGPWDSFEFGAAAAGGGGGGRGPGAARRVVALSLAAEEILLDLAGPARFAAVTRLARNPLYSNVTAKAAAVAETVTGQETERLIRLDPDLVIVATYTDRRARWMLERCGIDVLPLGEFRSLESIRAAIEGLGAAAGLEKEGAELASSFQARLQAARERAGRAAARRGGRRLSLLYLGTDLGSLWTAGAGTLVDEVLVTAGAANAAAEHGVAGEIALSKEAAVQWQPEVLLLEGDPAARPDRLAALRADPLLSLVPAARDGRVIVLPARLLTSTSHYAARAAEELAVALSPEVLGQ